MLKFAAFFFVFCAWSNAEATDRWQRIQAETATQSPLGKLVVAQGSGHDIQVDQPTSVIDEIRRLMLDLRRR